MSPRLRKLCRTANQELSVPALAALAEIAALDEPEVIKALVSVLDVPGIIGDTAAKALLARGLEVEPAMLRCLDSRSGTRCRRAAEILDALHGIPTEREIVDLAETLTDDELHALIAKREHAYAQ